MYVRVCFRHIQGHALQVARPSNHIPRQWRADKRMPLSPHTCNRVFDPCRHSTLSHCPGRTMLPVLPGGQHFRCEETAVTKYQRKKKLEAAIASTRQRQVLVQVNEKGFRLCVYCGRQIRDSQEFPISLGVEGAEVASVHSALLLLSGVCVCPLASPGMCQLSSECQK